MISIASHRIASHCIADVVVKMDLRSSRHASRKLDTWRLLTLGRSNESAISERFHIDLSMFIYERAYVQLVEILLFHLYSPAFIIKTGQLLLFVLGPAIEHVNDGMICNLREFKTPDSELRAVNTPSVSSFR